MFPYNKQQIVASFNRAAQHYDDSAILQNEVARRLFARSIGAATVAPQSILDLGSGTGTLGKLLQEQYPSVSLIQLDAALQMLVVARQSSSLASDFICADATSIPIASGSIDWVVSNLMLQWCDDVPTCFQEVARVLESSGIFHFTTLGPDTFCELRAAWEAVDDDLHVHHFTDMHDLGDALMKQGFDDPVVDCERITVYYDSVMEILKDIKGIGAQNQDHRRASHLTGKKRFTAMLQAYDAFRTEAGQYPVTYEVIYGYAKAPKPKQPATAVRIPVSSIGRIQR